jgi:hypothetical protein
MNFLWESWLGAFTATEKEAIINRIQGKSVHDYQALMTGAFGEMRRVLKSGRWLTVMFHNSSAQVWSAIQTALASSGFEIESTQTLDKQHGTFKQFVSANAVGYDLLIHCQKQSVLGANVRPSQQSSSFQARNFISTALRQNPEAYIIRYLHVDRGNEINTRKLYSLWLRERLENGEPVDISYEDFRHITLQVVQESGSRLCLQEELL